MVDEADVMERVKKVTAEKLGVPLEAVVPEASFTNELGADSLDTVELVMDMETEFDIEIPEEDALGLLRVSDVVTYITQKTR
ncbi:acyl carrier protein [Pseudomonas putida]|uniref:acyl carrier protein n=1 Tax=Pseudomonas putida TaxID=303 RepID=UPI0023647DD1|nr:acyl carrier protein [Pseudomonas putida]MDD1965784.1 acyl carrier protein [Pseudomonas putida]